MIKRALPSLVLFLVYSFLYLPIILLVINSFNASAYGFTWDGFSLRWYQQLLKNTNLLQTAKNSLVTASLSATLATLMGTLVAVVLYGYRFPGKQLLNGLLFMVMISPEIVMAISLCLLFMMIGLPLGFGSLLCAHITFCLPFVVITVYSRLQGFDQKMLEAARDLSASEWTILRKIILPLALPALLSSWLLSFTLSLDDVVISAFVSGPTYEILPLKIYSLVKVGISPEINALATLLLLTSLLLIVLSQQLLHRTSTSFRPPMWY
ncbi:MAG: spermidine/putrescine ABC transporter permease PotC [Candidatus Symbiodolus clandestinus]